MLFKVALKGFLTMKCYEAMLLCLAMRVPGLEEEPVMYVSLLLCEILLSVGWVPDMIQLQIAYLGGDSRKLHQENGEVRQER